MNVPFHMFGTLKLQSVSTLQRALKALGAMIDFDMLFIGGVLYLFFIGGARTLISRTQKCLVPISDVATVPDVLRENVSAVDRWIQVSF
ncbi:hypothetical protein OUZ56_003951 [Daphnia magna]|uniref:Uncharacterized protein n=1 Tax=Daphnia magna TaxID=35525 RepID=A0ABQ9YNA7_9CRUS|nr:hypothetical protein OUZ56_003951 [Daphnia magna]